MRKQDLIFIAGGTVKLAKLLGITSQAVSMWPETLTARQYHEVIGAFVAAGRYSDIAALVDADQVPEPEAA